MALSADWMDEDKVTFCGDMIKGRICALSSMRPVDEYAFNVKVCFTPLEDCPKGYMVDNGDVFGARSGGFKYGWGRDVRGNARYRSS